VYVIGFPFWLILGVAWKTPRTLRKAWRAFLAVTSLWAAAALCPVLLVLSLALLVLQSPNAVPALVIAQTCCLTLFLLCAVRWAADPLRPFHSLLTGIDWGFRKWESLPRTHSPSQEETKRSAEGLLQFVELLEKICEWVIRNINYMIKRTIVPLFSGVLVLLYLLTVLEYGIATYALQHQEKPAYSTLPPDFFRCLLYSQTVLTTSPSPDVAPVTLLGSFVYSMELFGTFLLVSAFFSMFSAAMGIHGEESVREVNDISTGLRAWLQKMRQQFQGEIIEGQATPVARGPSQTSS
jgi:hypothetical protein